MAAPRFAASLFRQRPLPPLSPVEGARRWLASGNPETEKERVLRPFSVSELSIQRRIGARTPLPDPNGLGFASVYSDLMCEADWDDQHGWYPPRIRPLSELSIHPGSTGLHYAISCLEGLKAYKTEDGRLLLFRPEDHIKRFCSSAERIALPSINMPDFLEMMKTFVRLEKDYILPIRGYSLYIRPLLFSTYVS